MPELNRIKCYILLRTNQKQYSINNVPLTIRETRNNERKLLLSALLMPRKFLLLWVMNFLITHDVQGKLILSTINLT